MTTSYKESSGLRERGSPAGMLYLGAPEITSRPEDLGGETPKIIHMNEM